MINVITNIIKPSLNSIQTYVYYILCKNIYTYKIRKIEQCRQVVRCNLINTLAK